MSPTGCATGRPTTPACRGPNEAHEPPQRRVARVADRPRGVPAAEIHVAAAVVGAMGRPDRLLDALKAGRAVPLVSATLLSAMMAAGLPEAAYKRFAFRGLDWAKAFRLTGRGELVELSDDEYDRLRDELPAG